MSRWRPPREKSSPYISPEGYARLTDEYDLLWNRRKEVTRALTEAAAEGDRSENAEYIYRKKELAGIDSRIRYLQKRLPTLKIVTEVNDLEHVYFGAQVTLESESGEHRRVKILGSDEIGNKPDNISIDSPLARALLNSKVGDEITLEAGGKEQSYCVIAIRYD